MNGFLFAFAISLGIGLSEGASNSACEIANDKFGNQVEVCLTIKPYVKQVEQPAAPEDRKNCKWQDFWGKCLANTEEEYLIWIENNR